MYFVCESTCDRTLTPTFRNPIKYRPTIFSVKLNISEYGSKIVHSNLYWLLNYIENYVKPCMAVIVSAPCRQNG